QPLVALAEARVIGEATVLGTGVPRRHAALTHHLADRLGPAPGLAVGRQRERRDLARAVTDDAVLLQHGGDVLRPGYAAGRGGTVEPVDDAADRPRHRAADLLAGEQL